MELLRRLFRRKPLATVDSPSGGVNAGRIFVSYSRRDVRAVDRVLGGLFERGVSSSAVFLDRGSIDGALEFPAVLAEAIAQCRVLLLFLSEHSVRSAWVKREVHYALSLGKHVLPLALEDVTVPPDLAIQIASIQQLRMAEGDWNVNVDAIVRSLERLGVGDGAGVTPGGEPPPVDPPARRPARRIEGSMIGELTGLLSLPEHAAILGWTVQETGDAADLHFARLVDKNTTGFYHPTGLYFVFQNLDSEPRTIEARLTTRGRVLKSVPTNPAGVQVRIPSLQLGARSRCTVVLESVPPGAEVVLAGGMIGPKGSERHDGIDELSAGGAACVALSLQDALQRHAADPAGRDALLAVLRRTGSWLEQAALCGSMGECCPREAEEALVLVATLPAVEDYPRLTALAALARARSARFPSALRRAVGRLRDVETAWRLTELIKMGVSGDGLDELRAAIQELGGGSDVSPLLLSACLALPDRGEVVGRVLKPLLSSSSARAGIIASLRSRRTSRGAAGASIVSALEHAVAVGDDELLTVLREHLVEYGSTATEESAHGDATLMSRARAVLGPALDELLFRAFGKPGRPGAPRAILACLPRESYEDARWIEAFEQQLREGNAAEAGSLAAVASRLPKEAARAALERSYDRARLDRNLRAHQQYLTALHHAGGHLRQEDLDALLSHTDRQIVSLAGGLVGGEEQTGPALYGVGRKQILQGGSPAVTAQLRDRLETEPGDAAAVAELLLRDLVEQDESTRSRLLGLSTALPGANRADLVRQIAASPLESLRLAAARHFPKTRCPEVVEPCLSFREDTSATVRETLARALWQWSQAPEPYQSKAVAALLELRGDPERAVASAALKSLCSAGHPVAVGEIGRLATSGDTEDVTDAADCLMALGKWFERGKFGPQRREWAEQILVHGDTKAIGTAAQVIHRFRIPVRRDVLSPAIEAGGERGRAIEQIVEVAETQRYQTG